MSTRLYELAGADAAVRFSPHCWKTRMALAHKGVEAERIAWRFTDKEAIAFSEQGRVPVLVDRDRTVSDSWRIALHLETAYPDRASLFGGPAGQAAARFVNAWADSVLLAGIAGLIVTDVFSLLHDGDRAYFRESREARFGKTLEAVTADRDEKVGAFRQSLHPLRATLQAQAFLGGEQPNYADYCVFGMFMWARCASDFPLLEAEDPVDRWRGRLLDAFDGMARSAPAVAA